MSIGGISIWQLLIILVIVLLLFGTKRLKSIGSDLGNAIKGFRSAVAGHEEDTKPEKLEEGAAKGGDEIPSAATAAKDKDKV